MCTEFVLAILYFFTIFLVNFFLFQLVKNYLKNIFFVTKVKNGFQNAKKQNRLLFSFLLQTQINFRQKKDERKKKFLSSLQTSFFPTKDIVLLGYFYRSLKLIEISEKKQEKERKNCFFELLEQQYLSSPLFQEEEKVIG